MIEQLISSYENRLCKQELRLVKSLYNSSNDIKAAELLAERLASKGYGLALKRASPIDVRAVNTELIKYDIASRTDTSINQINSLPDDVVCELIDFYKSNVNMGRADFKEKLCRIINVESFSEEEKEVKQIPKPEPVKKASLLDRLHNYEKLIKRSMAQ